MVLIIAQLDVPAPAQEVWDAVTDWTNHERWIPLTRVRVLTADPHGVGARFVARTGLGPFSVDDVMQVTAWAPPKGDLPGRWSVVKQGRIVQGGAHFQIQNRSGDVSSRVTWTEELAIAPQRLTRPLAPLVHATGRLGLVRALRLMADEFGR